MLSFLSVEEGKLFINKSSFKQFKLVFIRAEHMVMQGEQGVLFMDSLVGLGVGTCTHSVFTNIDLRLCLAPSMITTMNCSCPLICKDTPNTTVLSV